MKNKKFNFIKHTKTMIKWNYVLKFSISKSHEQLIQQIYQPKLKSNIKKKKFKKKN